MEASAAEAQHQMADARAAFEERLQKSEQEKATLSRQLQELQQQIGVPPPVKQVWHSENCLQGVAD